MVWRAFKVILAILPAAFGGLILAHLWPDEPPHYNLGRYPVASPVLKAGGDSAYLLIYGLRAAAGEDPFARGRLALEFEELTGERHEIKELSISEALVGGRPCSTREPACIARIAAALPDVDAMLAEHRVLLERYRLLYQQSDFGHVAALRLDAPVPDFSTLLTMQYLVHLSVLKKRAENDLDTAWSLLHADQAFWRRFLGRADTLIAKMVSVAAVSSGLQVHAFLLDAESGTPPIPRLSPAERSTLLALRSELQMMQWTLQNLETLGGFNGAHGVIWPLLPFKPVSTFNRYYAANLDLLKTSGLPAAELATAVREYPGARVRARWHDYLLNPRGLWFLELALPELGSYTLRVNDLDALILLVNLKAWLKANGLRPEDIKTVAHDLGQDLTNPYYPGDLARWDAEEGQLKFDRLPGDPEARNAQVSVAW